MHHPGLIMVVFALALTLAAPAAAADKPNTLSAAEKKAGWKLLFDGKTTRGWRGFKQAAFPAKGWAVEQGALRRVPGPDKPGDIVTDEKFSSFELKLDWRLSPGGNSGIKYLVDESLVKGDSRSGLGFEYQVLDDDKHPDAKQGKDGNRVSGALYDLIAPRDARPRPAGEWNETRLVVAGNRVEHWLNGAKIVEYERGSEALKTLIAGSKYKGNAAFGQAGEGHILLQDHQDEVAFRSIKVRPLPAQR